jgi:hypothetical protein
MGIPVLFRRYAEQKRGQDKNEHPFLLGSKNKGVHQLIINGRGG